MTADETPDPAAVRAMVERVTGDWSQIYVMSRSNVVRALTADIDALAAVARDWLRLVTPRPRSEYRPEMRAVLWWTNEGETMLHDGLVANRFTHFTELPRVTLPADNPPGPWIDAQGRRVWDSDGNRIVPPESNHART